VKQTVYLVDGNAARRSRVQTAIRASGLAVDSHASAEALLEALLPDAAGCAVAELCLPGMSGLALQEDLAARRPPVPIVLISGRPDVSSAVHAIKRGAVDFLNRPLRSKRLMQSIRAALKRDVRDRAAHRKRLAIESRVRSLTAREHEVLELVVLGEANKNIARVLGLSHKTIEAHRATMMQKMRADSLAALVHLVHKADMDDPTLQLGLTRGKRRAFLLGLTKETASKKAADRPG